MITEESIGRAGGGVEHGGFPLAELLQSLIGWALGGGVGGKFSYSCWIVGRGIFLFGIIDMHGGCEGTHCGPVLTPKVSGMLLN